VVVTAAQTQNGDYTRIAEAVGTASALGTATAHASSGGGCNDGGGSGYSYVVACISASGAKLEPNLYVLDNSPPCTSVSIWVNNANENQLTVWSDQTVNNGCALGIHGPWPLTSANTPGIVDGDTYYVYVRMNFRSGGYELLESPTEVLKY
jgi:hypothetical protein